MQKQCFAKWYEDEEGNFFIGMELFYNMVTVGIF